MATEELTHSTIAEMAPRLQRREVSPVEVTQAHLQRIERLNGPLRAYITILADTAMAAARHAKDAIMQGQYRGPLHGIPLALKDLFEIRHVPMTCGSKVLDDYVPLRHSTVTQRLLDAGAVLLGTLNMHELPGGPRQSMRTLGRRAIPGTPNASLEGRAVAQG